jgi:predicted XRE-type DNA-binding protein
MTDDTSIRRGNTQHFADIGSADADANRVRAELITRMNVLIGNAGWRKAEAARRLGLSSHDLSRLLRGQFRDIGNDRLRALMETLAAAAAAADEPIARLIR